MTPPGDGFLAAFVAAFAHGLRAADARRPVSKTYRPGTGPHTEDQQIRLAVQALRERGIEVRVALGVPYPSAPRQKCDIVIEADEPWHIEAKLFRPAGDNGKLNDQNLNHILSPFDADRSLLTDCRKLRGAGWPGRIAVLVIAYHWPERPFLPVATAFECLARAEGPIGPRVSYCFDGLIHPHHASGGVHAWEVLR